MNHRFFFHLFACLCFSLLGFLGNWFKVELFFNVDFLLGSFFVILAILMLGGGYGFIAGFFSATCTFFLWNHPWAIIIMTGEAFFVAFRVTRRKGDPVISDIIYWALIGMPLVYFFYHHVMAIQMQSTLLIMLKQAMNGIFNSLMATIVFLLLRQGGHPKSRRIPYSQAIFITMVSLVLIPAMIFLVVGMRQYLEHEKSALAEKVSTTSAIARKSLANWIRGNHQVVQSLSVLVGNPEKTPVAEIQHYVETLKATSSVFFRMGVLNKQSRTIAYMPLIIDGRSAIGVDFSDRPYIPLMKEKKQPYIPDMVMGKLGKPIPIAMLLAPIVVDGEYMGYAVGVLDISKLSGMITQLINQAAIDLTLVDGNLNVIAGTHSNLKIMEPFQRPYNLNNGNHSDEIFHWIPEPQAGTSIMQRWRASLLIKTGSISPDCNWKLIAEAPILPVLEDISRFSIKGLALLLIVTVTTVFLSNFFSKKIISTIITLQNITKFLPDRLASDAVLNDWPQSRIIELEALNSNFQEMAKALSVSFQEQKTLNETLENRVLERTKALQESEESLRFAIESAQMGIFDFRPETGAFFWDKHTKQNWGVRPDIQLTYAEVIGRIHQEDRERVEQEIKLALGPESDGYFESEYRLNWPDQTVHWALTKGQVYFEEAGGKRNALRIAGIHIDITERKQAALELESYRQRLEVLVRERTRQLEEKNELLQAEISGRNQIENELRLSREQLRTLTSRLLTAREEERISIAREIHDVMAQELTRLKLDLSWLQRRVTHPENGLETELLLERISGMWQVVDTAIRSVQKIATDLRPAVLDSLGLCAAIEWMAMDFQTRSGISCRANVPGEEPPIDRDAATAIFRIFQESLTNVLRHADASCVDVKLQLEGDHLLFIVRDNGRGIGIESINNPLSIGLTGMRERALLLGGRFTIQGRAGISTVIEVRLPLSKHNKGTGDMT